MKVEPWQELKPEELGKLLEELRETQERFPLTIVVENPQAPEARAFLKCLHDQNLLEADDALWVIGEGEYEDAIPEALRKDFISEDAYLNVQEQGDEERAAGVKALVSTLVPDLLFVADADAGKLKERLEKWERRVWAVIIGTPEDFDSETLSKLDLGVEARPDWLRRWGG